MPFQIIRNDITKVKADIIVNTANPDPIIGAGTDSAIYTAAGRDQLLAERQKIGTISPGKTVYTPTFKLSAKYIIHTVGPIWYGGEQGERDILRSCYINSLKLAVELKAQSIAFPLIATGTYGFPKSEALNIALAEIGKFLLSHDMDVILVVFDKKAFELSGEMFSSIEEYIDENYVREQREREYYDYNSSSHLNKYWLRLSNLPCAPIFYESAKSVGMSLDEMLNTDEDTFQQRLFHLIDERELDDVTVYKKANINRKVFSRIRCKPDYRPKKRTAVAFAIALELDMGQTLDLLARAEITFSPSNKFDIIISYFITNHIYDIFEINAALFKYGQPILGE